MKSLQKFLCEKNCGQIQSHLTPYLIIKTIQQNIKREFNINSYISVQEADWRFEKFNY